MVCSGNLAAMQSRNPNIVRQINEWQPLRASRNEDPLNWEAFRAHQRAMAVQRGDPNPDYYDPGAEPPQVFCNYRTPGPGPGPGPGPDGDNIMKQITDFVTANPLIVGGVVLLLLLMKGRR